MKAKLIKFSDQENRWIQDEADKREISFSDMLRRIVDTHYENNIVDRAPAKDPQ
jgi:hypothetical protein